MCCHLGVLITYLTLPEQAVNILVLQVKLQNMHTIDTCEICQGYIENKMQRFMSSWVWYIPVVMLPAYLIIRSLV